MNTDSTKEVKKGERNFTEQVVKAAGNFVTGFAIGITSDAANLEALVLGVTTAVFNRSVVSGVKNAAKVYLANGVFFGTLNCVVK